MENELIIKNVCSEVLNVKEEDVKVVKRLMGGMSNYTYIIKVNDELYTFRIPGKNAEKFVDRNVEESNINLVKSLDLNNDTVYFNQKTGYKIAKYINGQPLHELNPLEYLEKASVVLHKIHESGKKSESDYNPLARLELYEGYNKEYDHIQSERYLALKKEFLSYRKFLDESKLTLCHGDSQISNFVVTDNGLKLMDWEFTGNNDPYYDIACFGNNDFDHAEKLLPVYLGKTPSDEDYNRLYFFRTFQCLQWHNVAWYKEYIGLSKDLGVDFKFFANLYLDKAEKLLNSMNK
ncbi:MAG: choline/ethanolamine kinase family protein [Candidatus Izemoplasma sp.]